MTLHGVAPRGLADTTDASFGYFLCTMNGPPTYGVAPSTDTLQSCRKVVAADDARMSLEHQQLLVAITPTHAGVVAFHGIDVHYSQDGHDGSQRTGGDVRLRVSHRK
ncbi:hypothetical protein EFL95_01015 [Nocardioides marmorisolisilvae]|uniref:Uncharacterized protein n=1 Tax=Nocardioides marmorisolisilvae TaxID=1542737 RepID=A0A3N0DZF2_9ACTN|nr:hypothetical protein EFL95_01015 [Nocardioides marmorisolisilvae]